MKLNYQSGSGGPGSFPLPVSGQPGTSYASRASSHPSAIAGRVSDKSNVQQINTSPPAGGNAGPGPVAK